MTAADTLRRRGYEQVTVFEQLGRVGGKVHSLRSGAGVVELGAVLASTECTLVLELAERYRIPYAPYPVSLLILDENGERQSIESFLAGRYDAGEIARAISNYAATLQRFPELQRNSLSELSNDLCLPFAQFAQKHGFSPIAELARSMLVGFGYSYYETTPAVYFMKLIGWLLKPGGAKGLQPGEFYMFPNGYQSIWEAIASAFEVHLDAKITSIKRSQAAGPIQVTVNGTQEYEFDAVILSAPLHTLGSFLDLSAAESALFAQIRSDRYFVNLFNASGLATGEFLFFHDHARPAKINHVNAWANRDPSLPVYIAWQLADRELSLEQVSEVLKQDVAAQGGTFGELKLRQEWDYFPRVDGEALRDGFYRRVEALQGVDKLFYVGSSLSFETVEHSARHAREVVSEHFPPFTACN
jgi:protoporphyrinogen/coproporphyrinogen III oxidase